MGGQQNFLSVKCFRPLVRDDLEAKGCAGDNKKPVRVRTFKVSKNDGLARSGIRTYVVHVKFTLVGQI